VDRGDIQATIALVSFADPTDLPRLCAFFSEPGGATPQGDQRTGFLPQMLYTSYGNAAVPYLKTALNGPLGRFTSEGAARQLIAAGDPAGFQFAVRAIEQKSASSFDMVQALKSHFPELKTAKDDAIIAFAKQRAGSAQ
jgi:hypothetical protein